MTQEITKPEHVGSTELLRWFHIPHSASFDQKREALQMADEKTAGESDMGANYVGRVLWVAEVYQHKARINVTKNGGPPIKTVDSMTGEVISSNYDTAQRTVLHVVAVESRLLKEPIKVGFVGRSVQWYFEDKVIPLFGLQFEHPLPFVFTKNQSGAYSIECPTWAVFPGGEQ